MSITVHIEGDLRKYCEGQHSLSLEGATVSEVLHALTSRYSDLVNRLFQGGRRNCFIPVFVNNEDIRYLQDVDTPLKDGDEITIFPPVSGGAEDIKKIEKLLGAKIVGDVSEVEPGVFGDARLAEILAERLEPSQGKRPGRPTDLSWVRRPKVPMSVETVRKLIEISDQVSTDTRRVSPMQVAAHFLEEAVNHYCQTPICSDGKQDEPEVRYDDRR